MIVLSYVGYINQWCLEPDHHSVGVTWREVITQLESFGEM